MRKIPVLLLLTIAGCASSPTQYIPEKNKHGYSDKIIDPTLRVAEFNGNSSTKKEMAELFAKFRAIEICHEMKTNTHILTVNDKTYSKDIVQANTSGPSYSYGMSPYYGRYGGYGGGVGMSYNMSNTSYSSETYTYPHFEVYFECTNTPYDAGVHLKPLSASQMQALVKDLQGAVVVDEVLEYSPNKGKLLKGDIITKANGERVTNVLEVFKASRKKPGSPLNLEFYRDGEKMQTTGEFKDVTDLALEAQKEILKTTCKMEEMSDKSKLCKK
jgi:hypothetical protein